MTILRSTSLSFFLADENDTVALGRQLGERLVGGAVVYLEGTLGAGKTTLCRGVLSAFGYSGAVKSPTYTLVEPYDLKDRKVFHFDLYRLGDAEELEFMGIRDYFVGKNLCLVEWPDKGLGYIPKEDLRASLSIKGLGREVVLQAQSPIGEELISSLTC